MNDHTDLIKRLRDPKHCNDFRLRLEAADALGSLPSSAPASLLPVSERQKFDAWLADHPFLGDEDEAWEVWQACASLAAPRAERVEAPAEPRTDPLQMRHTHSYGFRSGEWANVEGVVMATPQGKKPRPAYQVRYDDGKADLIAVNDIELEFRAASDQPAVERILAGRESISDERHAELRILARSSADVGEVVWWRIYGRMVEQEARGEEIS